MLKQEFFDDNIVKYESSTTKYSSLYDKKNSY